jgi:hypothetical protein
MFTVCLHINILWIHNIQLTIFSNVVLLKPRYRATEIKKEIGYLKQLEALGIKTPRRYKKYLECYLYQ